MVDKVRIIIMAVLSIAICALFTIEAFAAVNINLTFGGTVRYTAKDIGAEIAGTIKVNTTGQVGEEKFITLSSTENLGTVDSYGVFTIAGTGINYSTQVLADDDTTFDVVTDTIDIYLFVRNRGARPFMPTVAFQQDSGLLADVTEYYFTTTGTNPIGLIREGNTAAQLCSTIDALTPGSGYLDFAGKASIVHDEVYFAKVTLSVDPNYELDVIGAVFDYLMQVNFMLDVQYITDDDFLTVTQQNNVADPAWTKVGYNSTLSATAIKANTNNITALDNAYNNPINGNADLTQIKSGLTYECDDYDDAIVYKDIDVVNIDINTGEVIGKLSDVNYPFEWYGGSVTLDAGTTLASGRVLTAPQTFTVDVYTYYPTMYVRRWVVGNYTYLSLTDQPYTNYGFIKIDEHYVATCEAFTYNPDKTIAYNDFGIITRSYVNGYNPLTDGSNAYMETNLGFTNNTSFDSRVEARPAAMLGFANNLTQQWNTFATNNPAMAEYTQKSVSGCAGQDWHQFVYQILYTIKYASNNSQEMVGLGNAQALSAYSNTASYDIQAEKIGGTIGFYDANKNSSNTAGDNLRFNDKHLAYANNNITPYYAPDFLVYKRSGDNAKNILRDGYVGTNGYTSVSCLGMFNPWGNIWSWICGVSIAMSGKTCYCYVQFDDYDTTNYYIANDGTTLTTFEAKETALYDMGYVKLSYAVPASAGWFRCLGVSEPTTSNPETNGMLTLVGVPTSASSSGGNATTGLCDQMASRGKSEYIYGLCVGNQISGGTAAGLFSYSTRNYANHKWDDIGFRAKLI